MRSTQASANGRKTASATKGASDRAAPARREQRRAGRPTSAELERRKAKVMQVATSLFVQHGYAATSLVDIAKAAGVATRTLYQHFGDKEAIFLEVVTARESGAVFPLPSIPKDVALFDALMFAARYVCEVSFRPRSVDLMRLMIAESRRFPDFMSKLSFKTFARFQANVAVLLDEIVARQLAQPIDTKLAAALFVDLILGSRPLMVYAGWVTARPTDAELEAKINLFMLGEFGPEAAKNARKAPPPAPPKAKRAKTSRT